MAEKVGVTEFAARIKERYPQYKDVDDVTLSKRIVEKYPDYASTVSFDDAPVQSTKQEVVKPADASGIPTVTMDESGNVQKTGQTAPVAKLKQLNPDGIKKMREQFLNMPAVDDRHNREIYYQTLQNNGFDVEQARSEGEKIAEFKTKGSAGKTSFQQEPDVITPLSDYLTSIGGKDLVKENQEKQRNDYIEKISDFQMHPQDNRKAYELGYFALKNGDPNIAEKAFKKTLQLNPETGEALLGLIAVEKQRGNKAKVEEYYKQYRHLTAGQMELQVGNDMTRLGDNSDVPVPTGSETNASTYLNGIADAIKRITPGSVGMQMISGGVDKIAKTNDAQKEAVTPVGKFAAGSLNAITGVGEALMGAGGFTGAGAMFTMPFEQAQNNLPPEASKWLSPAHAYLESYYEDGQMPLYMQNFASVGDFAILAAVAHGAHVGYGEAKMAGKAKSMDKILNELPEETKQYLARNVEAKTIAIPQEEYASQVKDKVLNITQAAKEVKVQQDVAQKLQEPPAEVKKQPIFLKDVKADTDVMFEGKTGKIDRGDDGTWYFDDGENPPKMLKVEDKNAAHESPASLGLHILPDVPHETIMKAMADREQVGEVEYKGNKYFVSTGNKFNPADVTGDIVGRVMSDGSIKDPFTHHPDETFARQRKLAILNEYLKSKGLPNREKLYEPKAKDTTGKDADQPKTGGGGEDILGKSGEPAVVNEPEAVLGAEPELPPPVGAGVPVQAELKMDENASGVEQPTAPETGKVQEQPVVQPEAKAPVEESIDVKIDEQLKAAADKPELKGKDKIASGIADLASALGITQGIDGGKRPEVTQALVKIGQGLIEAGLATAEDVVEKVKVYIDAHWKGKVKHEDYADDLRVAFSNETGISHERGNETARKIGVEEYTPDKKQTIEEWDKEADARLRDDPDTIPKLIKRLEKGGEPTAVDQRVMARHLQSLAARIDVNSSPELIAEYKHAKELNDIQGGREVARSLAARQGALPVEDTLADMMVSKMDAVGVDELTPEQKTHVQKQFDSIVESKRLADEKLAEYERKFAEMEAGKAVAKAKSIAGVRRTHDEYVSERTAIKTSIGEKLKALRSQQQASILPYANELIAIAPDVAKLMRSYVEEGITELTDVIKKLHGELQEHIPAITEKDVQDVIAGKYNEQRKTQSEVTKELISLRAQAKLWTKYEALANGEAPVTEKRIVQHNQKLKAIRDQIKALDATAEFDPLKLNADQKYLMNYIKRNKAQQEKLEQQIKDKDFETDKRVPILDNKELQQKYPGMYKEVLDSMVAREDAKHDWDLALYEDQKSKRKLGAKALDLAKDIAGTAKSIKLNFDDSFAFLQGTLPLLANPREGAKALREHALDAFSERRFQRSIAAIYSSSYWDLIRKSGLDVIEPRSLKAERGDEVFDRNLLNKKLVHIKGKDWSAGDVTTRPFERAFTSLGNNLRVNIFLRKAKQLLDEGKTFESHPEDFKGIARVVNELTGRGKVHRWAEGELVNTLMLAPKLYSSNFNLLGVGDLINPITTGKKGFYRSLSPEAQKFAARQVLQGVATGISIMVAAKYLGGAEDVDFDPRSVTFGSVQFTKNGNRYNLFQRFTPFIRHIVMQAMGEKVVNGQTVDVDKTSEAGKFVRGRLNPIVGSAYSLWKGKDYMGKDYKLSDVPADLFTPLSFSEFKKGWENEELSSLLTRDPEAFFGMGVSNEKDFPKNSSAHRKTKKTSRKKGR